MKYFPSAICFTLFLIGCDASDNDHEVDEGFSMCQGYNSPRITIYVRDSLSEEIIESAFVQIHIEGNPQTVLEATFVADEDNVSNTAEISYQTWLEESEEYEYGITVAESNYHTFVSRNHPFELGTSCGADNSVTKTIYLCRLGNECL